MSRDVLTADVAREGNTLVVTDRFRPNRKQWDTIKAVGEVPPQGEVLFDGSVRGGKTQTCCKILVALAWKYGGTWLVARSTSDELEESTKKVMLRGDGDMPPACPPELIRRNYAQGRFNKTVLKNGGEILYRSLEPDERGKIRNLTLAGCFIDQVEEFEDDGFEDFYDELLGRLADPLAPRVMLLAANPGPEDHWVSRRFGCTDDTRLELDPEVFKMRRRINVNIHDNAHNLDPAYVRSLLATEFTRPDYFKRMVLGIWGAFGGKRFKMFSRAQHVIDPHPIPEWWEKIAGMDWGSKNPTVYLSMVFTPEGRGIVVAEHYQAGWAVSKHAAAIKLIEQNENEYNGFAVASAEGGEGTLHPRIRWLDANAFKKERQEFQSIPLEFNEYGIVVARAQNDRLSGWNRVEEFLSETLPDGKPKLQIFSTCHNLIRELPGLRYRTTKQGMSAASLDDVEKVKDHAPDALRYVLMSRPTSPTAPVTPQEHHTRDELMKRMVERAKGRGNVQVAEIGA